MMLDHFKELNDFEKIANIQELLLKLYVKNQKFKQSYNIIRMLLYTISVYIYDSVMLAKIEKSILFYNQK